MGSAATRDSFGYIMKMARWLSLSRGVHLGTEVDGRGCLIPLWVRDNHQGTRGDFQPGPFLGLAGVSDGQVLVPFIYRGCFYVPTSGKQASGVLKQSGAVTKKTFGC